MRIRVLTVDRIDLRVSTAGLYAFVEGTVPTPGWTNLILAPMETVLSSDGVLDLEFVGDPPDPPIMSPKPVPVSTHTWIPSKSFEINRLVGVLVHARRNNEYSGVPPFYPEDLMDAIKLPLGDWSPVISGASTLRGAE